MCVAAAAFGRGVNKVAMAAGTIRFSRLLLPLHLLRRAGKQQAAAGGASGGSRRPFWVGNNGSKAKIRATEVGKVAFWARFRVPADAASLPRMF